MHDAGMEGAPAGPTARGGRAGDAGGGHPGRPTRAATCHHHAGHAVVCFLLYGDDVIKDVAVDPRDGANGRTTTYSRVPVPLACRPPAGEPRRGNPAPVSPAAIVDAQGVLRYAGMVAEHLHAGARDGGTDEEPAASRQPHAHRDREALSVMARSLGIARPAEHFYREYWEEARRLLRAHWSAVQELAAVLEERGRLNGRRVDALLEAHAML